MTTLSMECLLDGSLQVATGANLHETKPSLEVIIHNVFTCGEGNLFSKCVGQEEANFRSLFPPMLVGSSSRRTSSSGMLERRSFSF